jgi:hypothetical protein
MKLFTALAGISADTFDIGEVTFMAAPLTIAENAEYNALPTVQVRTKDGVIEIIAEDARAEFWADKLRRRLKGNKTDPAKITAQWFMENCPRPTLAVLEHVMFYGELPGAGENTKAP